MASRRFFGYDPYDSYYYTSPYHYPYPYYHHQQPAPSRRAGGFFPVAGDADQYYSYQHKPATARQEGSFFPATGDVDPYYQPTTAHSAGGIFPTAGNVDLAATRSAVRPKVGASRSVSSIPVRFVSSDPEPEVAMMPVQRAAVRLQAAARGFLTRRAVRALRAVEREAEEVAEKLAREAEALRGDARARVAVGEALMRLLLRLDAVRGAREYRRRVAKRVLALQDFVDALEQRPVAVPEEAEAEAAGTTTDETVAEENAVATEMPSAVEKNGVTETVVAMEVDGDRAVAEDREPAPDGASVDGDKPADEDAEGEWEMVVEEPAAAVPAAEETTTRAAETGGVETKKLMGMVAALCEQSAQQCEVIGALAKRVDALERAVRRVEEAERRRWRAKKLRKEGKRSKHIKFYSD